MRNGIDYSVWRTTPAWLRGNGFDFVVRYLSWLPADADKVISKAEYDELRGGGIDLVLNWEYQGHADVLGGFDSGKIQAAEAMRQAQALGAWPCVIYFSCDWDVAESEQPAVDAYLSGCASTLGGPQYVGVYGGYWSVKRALEAGVAAKGWQTLAWSGSPPLWYPGAALRQVEVGLAGDSYDRDQAMFDNFGQVGAPITASAGTVTKTDSQEEHMFIFNGPDNVGYLVCALGLVPLPSQSLADQLTADGIKWYHVDQATHDALLAAAAAHASGLQGKLAGVLNVSGQLSAS